MSMEYHYLLQLKRGLILLISGIVLLLMILSGDILMEGGRGKSVSDKVCQILEPPFHGFSPSDFPHPVYEKERFHKGVPSRLHPLQPDPISFKGE